jgi:hypothetical protein
MYANSKKTNNLEKKPPKGGIPPIEKKTTKNDIDQI